MADEKLIMVCGHCGNKTAFELMGQYSRKVSYYSTYTQKPAEYDVQYRFLRCLTCSNPTLTYDEGLDEEALYPGANHSLTNLPMRINKEYEATLKVRNISSNACAVLARRTLEAIFTHENAEGKTLMEKVNNLIKSERIPPLVADTAHLGRQIGNLGAHFDKEEVTEEDVTAMLDFLETILEYLYVLPPKVAAVKSRLNRAS